MTQLERLGAAVDEALLKNLRPGLREALDEALAAGESPTDIMRSIRAMTGGPSSPRGGLTYLAVQAHLARRAGLKEGASP